MTNVVMAGVQSQANKNFWYAYALWQQKVAQALARRRAEAEARAKAKQAQQPNTTPPKSSPFAKLLKVGLFIIALGGVGLAGGSVQVSESPMSVANQRVNDVFNPPDNSVGLDFCGVMAIICPVGGGGGVAGEGGGGGSGGLFEWILLVLASILVVDATSDTQVLPYPQIGPMPYNPDEEYLDEIPLDRILRIPWIDFLNPEPNEPDGCNSEEFAIWWNALPLANPGGAADQFIYEAQVARGVETMGTARTVPAPGLNPHTIAADGADPNRCLLLEAKYSENPNNPAWREGGYSPILNQADDEISRYYLAMIANPQVLGLEIRTNSPIAQAYFEERIIALGFTLDENGFVTFYPFVQN